VKDALDAGRIEHGDLDVGLLAKVCSGICRLGDESLTDVAIASVKA